MSEDVWAQAEAEVAAPKSNAVGDVWSDAQKEIEMENTPSHKAVTGFWANLRDPTKYETNQSYLKDVAQLAVKKMRGTDSEYESELKLMESREANLPIAIQEISDQLNHMWENNLGHTPEYNQLEQNYHAALEQHEAAAGEQIGLVDSFLAAWEEDPGAVGAELINAAVEDPEFFLVPEAGVAVGTKLAATFARIGERSGKAAKVVGTVGGGATFEAALAASLQAARDINRTGEVVPDNVESAAKAGAMAGGVMSGMIGSYRGIQNIRSERAFQKAIDEDKVLADVKRIEEEKAAAMAEEMVSMVEKKAISSQDVRSAVDKLAETVTSSVVIGKSGKPKVVTPKLTKTQKQKRADMRAALEDASKPEGRTGESYAAFNARMGRDAMDDWNQRIALAKEYEMDNKIHIQTQKEAMWAAREAEQASTKANGIRQMREEQRKLQQEKNEVQELIGTYVPEFNAKTPMAQAMETAAQGTSLTAITKQILDRNAKMRALVEIEKAKQVNPNLTNQELVAMLRGQQVDPNLTNKELLENVRGRQVSPVLTNKEVLEDAAAQRKSPHLTNREMQGGYVDPKVAAATGAITAVGLGAYTLWENDMHEAAIAAMMTPAAPFLWRSLRKAMPATDNLTTRIMEPVYDRINDVAPKIALKMRNLERLTMERAKQLNDVINPFLESFAKLPKTTQTALWKAMLNQDETSIKAILAANPAAAKAYKGARAALDSLYIMQKNLGVKMPYLQHYMPRILKDRNKVLAAMEKEDLDTFQKIVKQAETKKNRTLTGEEYDTLLNSYLLGYMDSKVLKLTPGFTKHRSGFQITDDLLEAYADPSEAINRYVQSALDNIYRRELFGKVVRDKHGDNVTASIYDYLERKGIKDIEEVKELKELIQTRLEASKLYTSPKIAWYKNLTYASLLGNPHSALTQIGDVFLSAYKNGLTNSVVAMVKTLAGKNELSVRDMGLIENISHETVGHMLSTSRKVMEKSFLFGGFKHVDALGKSTMINAAFRKFHKSALGNGDKLKQYESLLSPEDYAQLIDDFKNKRVTDLTKMAAFNELADMQPISMLEMPEAYLKNPNGRVMYMFQTFTMKYLNRVKQDTVKQWQKGNKVDAIKNLALLYTYGTLGNLTSNELKNFIFQKDKEQDELVVDAMLKGTGVLNRYTFGVMQSSAGPASEFVSGLAPTLSIADPATRALLELGQGEKISSGTVGQTIRMIPVLGPILYNYGMGGVEATMSSSDWDVNYSSDFGGVSYE